MADQLVRFVNVADPEEISVAQLYLDVLPPVGTEVTIREEDVVDDDPKITWTRWIVDHHYWHIDRRWTGMPNGKGGIAHGWRHLLSAFVYLRRVEKQDHP